MPITQNISKCQTIEQVDKVESGESRNSNDLLKIKEIKKSKNKLEKNENLIFDKTNNSALPSKTELKIPSKTSNTKNSLINPTKPTINEPCSVQPPLKVLEGQRVEIKQKSIERITNTNKSPSKILNSLSGSSNKIVKKSSVGLQEVVQSRSPLLRSHAVDSLKNFRLCIFCCFH